jgi:hypothetical protein
MPEEGAAESGPGEQRLRLSKRAPLAQALVETIHAGEVESLIELLGQHPGLAAARTVDDKGGSGTTLHMATDWPGFFPRGPEVVSVLVDGGADIEATGASIGGGTPLDDAFWQACHGGERRVAEHLLAHGADLNGTPSWGGDRPLDAADGIDTGREALVNWLRAQGATKSGEAAT